LQLDYSGTQACKGVARGGLRSRSGELTGDDHDGSRVGDRTYVEPLTADFVAAIIKRERPDALPDSRWSNGAEHAVELAQSASSMNTTSR
jgi:carbamoyl-phosphate synthase large subunit